MHDAAGPAAQRRPAGGRRPRLFAALLTALLLAACTRGGTPTPPPSPTGTPGALVATPGLPAPHATLPPTPPTATATRPGTPATPTRVSTPGAGRRATISPARALSSELPAGWRVYNGALPFTIAYPPDWTVEEDAARGLAYFYPPDPARTTFLVIATGAPEPAPNLDVLRHRWFQARTAPCARFAVVATGQERHSGLDFATVGATCDLPGGLAYSLTGIAVRDHTPWIYEFDAPYGTFPTTLAAAFTPMLQTLQIAGTGTP